MSFGLSNVPNTFMRLMNTIMKPFISHLLVIYFDGFLILINSLDKESHLYHLRMVLKMLRAAKLYVNFMECFFCQLEVIFLSFIVATDGSKVDPAKIKATID